jgi:hypothetical protein
MDKFDKYINDIDWNDKKGYFDDVADMCNEFTNTFLEIARDCIRIRSRIRISFLNVLLNQGLSFSRTIISLVGMQSLAISKNVLVNSLRISSTSSKFPILSFQSISFIFFSNFSMSILSYCQRKNDKPWFNNILRKEIQ